MEKLLRMNVRECSHKSAAPLSFMQTDSEFRLSLTGPNILVSVHSDCSLMVISDGSRAAVSNNAVGIYTGIPESLLSFGGIQ